MIPLERINSIKKVRFSSFLSLLISLTVLSVFILYDKNLPDKTFAFSTMFLGIIVIFIFGFLITKLLQQSEIKWDLAFINNEIYKKENFIQTDLSLWILLLAWVFLPFLQLYIDFFFIGIGAAICAKNIFLLIELPRLIEKLPANH